ncbi:MAG: N-acetylneuraminate synthase family protein [Gemmatimonadaceae bacterium]|nr:N-acetylneuraminate synthase family protein [Gemmatimonadaceae bacterium]
MSVKVIAEIAQGYEGKPEQALLLARAGVASGADAVKFQCVYADEIAVPAYRYHSFFRTLEMPEDVWREIASIVRDGERQLILNVGGERSLDMASRIGADAVKFHATSFFCDELITTAKSSFDTVYMSVGGLSVDEIDSFLERHHFSPGEVAFTYGFQASPTPIDKNNLAKIGALMHRFPGFVFGFEDHTDAASPDRFVIPLMALAYGVQHLEKHLTLDAALKLEDAESALSVTDFSAFVALVRRTSVAIGDGDLSLTDIEQDYRRRVLKVAVAKRDLAAGEVLSEENTALRRVPELQGEPILRRAPLYGRTVQSPVSAHTQLTNGMLEN